MGVHLISLGDTMDGEKIELDFDTEGIRFILLTGMTGSGKSMFHSRLYREFMHSYTLEELGFIFLDMTRSDFLESEWDVRYFVRPIAHDIEGMFSMLESAESDTARKLIIHVEECDMVYHDRARFEKAIEKILNDKKNISIVYSTSRIDPNYLTDWLEKYIDMKVTFRVANLLDSQFLLGSDDAFLFREPGEHIISYGEKMMHCYEPRTTY